MARDSTLLRDVEVDSLSGSCVSGVVVVASHLPMENEGATRWLGGGGLRKWGGRDIAHRQAYQAVGVEVSLRVECVGDSSFVIRLGDEWSEVRTKECV